MPRDITDNPRSEIAKLLTLPDLKECLAAPGMEPAGSTPAQFAEFARRENTQRSKVVKAAGMQAE
jgi:tripartite-type tricarboxylate transporter receptor subunit TctC